MGAADDERLMERALELARRGPARGINPRVGCVIASPDGTILAEGWHRGAGTPHAEVDALSKLGADAARGATVVVTLEPCNHTGRTPPCVDALLKAGVARVVYGFDDPGERSRGGAERLRHGGVQVVPGVCAAAAEEALGDWASTLRLHRPHVTLKWASSLDGRTAAADGSSRWITGEDSRIDAHRLRARHDAIAVGTGTLLADDPSLTARDANGAPLPHQPAPIVFGTRDVPAGARLRRHPLPLRQMAGHDLSADLRALRESGIRSLFVEGGARLASAFVAAGLVDEYVVYLAPTLIGGPRLALTDLGVPTIDDARRLHLTDVDRCGDDVRLRLRPEPAPADDGIPTTRAEAAITITATTTAHPTPADHSPSRGSTA